MRLFVDSHGKEHHLTQPSPLIYHMMFGVNLLWLFWTPYSIVWNPTLLISLVLLVPESEHLSCLPTVWRNIFSQIGRLFYPRVIYLTSRKVGWIIPISSSFHWHGSGFTAETRLPGSSISVWIKWPIFDYSITIVGWLNIPSLHNAFSPILRASMRTTRLWTRFSSLLSLQAHKLSFWCWQKFGRPPHAKAAIESSSSTSLVLTLLSRLSLLMRALLPYQL